MRKPGTRGEITQVPRHKCWEYHRLGNSHEPVMGSQEARVTNSSADSVELENEKNVLFPLAFKFWKVAVSSEGCWPGLFWEASSKEKRCDSQSQNCISAQAVSALLRFECSISSLFWCLDLPGFWYERKLCKELQRLYGKPKRLSNAIE